MLTKSQKVIIAALFATGLVSYLHAIAFALGASSHSLISPFFFREDLFADFFKIIASYPHASNINIETWLPDAWEDIINHYIMNNPYSSNASLADSKLTNFHGPPFGIAIIVLYGYMCTWLSPTIVFLFTLIGIFAWLYYCVSLSYSDVGAGLPRLAFTALCILIFPSIFAITRGHVWSYLVAVSICSSFLLALRFPSRVLLPSVLIGIAINFRPNIVFLMPILFLAFPKSRRNLKLALTLVGSTLSILFLAYLAARLLYPSWNVEVFSRAYGFYSRSYEFGGSTFLGATTHAARQGLQQLGFSLNNQVASLTRYLFILSGLLICLQACSLYIRKRIGLPRAILLSSAGMILATPTFADYHLLILFTPVLCNNLFENNFLFFNNALEAKSMQMLTRIDFVFIVFLLTPKAFPIKVFGAAYASQAIVNPLAILAYSALMLTPAFKKMLLIVKR